MGETANLAARLQAMAAPGTVVISATPRCLLASLFEFRDLGSVEVKGFAAPVRAYQVSRSSAAESRFEAMRTTTSPLVGRAEELELLLRRWSQAKAGDGRVVLISSEAGVGKSRIAEALAEHVAGEPHIRLPYFCSPHHQDSAPYPVIVQMERAASFVHGDAPGEKLAKLQASLAAAAPTTEDVALLAELHGLSSANVASPLGGTPPRKKEKTFEALLR